MAVRPGYIPRNLTQAEVEKAFRAVYQTFSAIAHNKLTIADDSTESLALDDQELSIDAALESIAALVTAADKMIYTSDADTYATTDLTAFARTLLDDANAQTVRATIDAVGGRSGLTEDQILTADSNGDAQDGGSTIANVLDRANHTGTQGMDTLTETATKKIMTDTERTNLGNQSGTNTGDVTVSDSPEIDFTLTGQEITASIVAASIDETKLDASVNDSLDLADSAVQTETDPVVGAINGLVKADGGGNISAAVEDTDYQGVLAEGAFADGDKTKLDNQSGTNTGDEPDATTSVKGIVELATDGESAANVVVQGNDSRLSDARTPTAHASTHTDGTDDIAVVVGDSGSGGTKGLVPAPGAGDAAADKFLKADGTWTVTGAGADSVQGASNLTTQYRSVFVNAAGEVTENSVMVTNASGKILIGATSPVGSEALRVNGIVYVDDDLYVGDLSTLAGNVKVGGQLIVDYSTSVGTYTDPLILGGEVSGGELVRLRAYRETGVGYRGGSFVLDTATTAGVNTEALRVNSSQQVLIGTTSPFGSEKLRVQGRAHIQDGSSGAAYTLFSGTKLVVESSGTTALQIISPSSSACAIFFGDENSEAPGQIQYNHLSNYLMFSANASEALRVNSSQQVLIGTTSAVGSEKLRVNGSAYFDGAITTTNVTASGVVTIGNSSGTAGTTLDIDGLNDTLYLRAYSSPGGSAGGKVIIQTSTAGSGPNDSIIVDESGNVGIGLTPTSNMGGLAIEQGLLTLKETTTPTADTNYGKVYTKSDNKLYFQDGAGTEHEIAFV